MAMPCHRKGQQRDTFVSPRVVSAATAHTPGFNFSHKIETKNLLCDFPRAHEKVEFQGEKAQRFSTRPHRGKLLGLVWGVVKWHGSRALAVRPYDPRHCSCVWSSLVFLEISKSWIELLAFFLSKKIN
jgi:hypothetical protein